MAVQTSSNTNDLLRAWFNAQKEVERLKDQIRRAETDERNAHNKLGEHLEPDDMTEGETISIWVNLDAQDRLLNVTKKGFHEYVIGWRPKKK